MHTFSETNNLYGTYVSVTGKVTDVEDTRFTIKTENYYLNVNNYDEFEAEVNDVVKVCGELGAYESAQFNGDFDYKLYYGLKGILGEINPETVKFIRCDNSFSLRNIVKKYIYSKIIGYTANYKSEGFVFALLTGDTDKLDSDVKEAFRLTGISHLIAISGLHMGIFLSFFAFASARLRKNRIVHILFILVIVVLYVLFVGERASILRAGIMAVISYGISGIKRRSDGVMNLVLAGVMICFINPLYATDAGFQLSFTVTLGIVLYSEFFKHKFVAVPVISMLFVLPVVLYYYNTVSLESVLVNIMVVPLVPFIILFGYIGCIFPLFGFMASILASLVIYAAEFFASAEFLHIVLPSPEFLHFIIWYLIWIAAYFFFDNYRIEKAVLTLLLALTVGVVAFAGEGDEDGVVCFIDNGSFNMEHITTENGLEIFVDCGYKAADYAVKTGIDEIYLVVISDNNKKYYKGLEELCESCNVRTILVPDKMKNKDLKLENSRILYYNQDDYTFYVDNAGFKYGYKDGVRYLSISVDNEIFEIQLGN